VADESPHFCQNGKNPTSSAFTPDRYFGDGGVGANSEEVAKDFDPEQPSRCGSSPRDELQDSSDGFTAFLAFVIRVVHRSAPPPVREDALYCVGDIAEPIDSQSSVERFCGFGCKGVVISLPSKN